MLTTISRQHLPPCEAHSHGGTHNKDFSFPCFSEPRLTFSEKKAHLKVCIYAVTGLGSGWSCDQGKDASAPIHTLDIIGGHWSQGQGRGFWQGSPLEAGESPPRILCQLFLMPSCSPSSFSPQGFAWSSWLPPPLGTHLLVQS